MDFAKVFLMILFYILVIAVILYFAGKILRGKFFGQQSGKHVGLIEQLYLGPKRNLSLIKVKNKVILLGVTANNISKLKEWDEQDFGELVLKEDLDFKSILNKFRRDEDD
ncbi:MAG: FliO/MopB family protein [Halanaerobiaceae bacterium]